MGAVKKSKIKSVSIERTDKKRPQNLADQIASTHLRFVERKMDELGLRKQEQVIVLNGIISNLKLQENNT